MADEYTNFRTIDFFTKHCGAPLRKEGKETLFKCPKCTDKNREIYVNPSGKWNCKHAKCAAESGCNTQKGGPKHFLDLIDPSGKDTEKFDELDGFGRNSKTPPAATKSEPAKKKIHKTLSAMTASMPRWTMVTDKVGSPAKVTGTWAYQDRNGKDAFAVIRLEGKNKDENEKPKKIFLQAHPVPGGWEVGGIKSGRPLYRLPELLKDSTSPVIVVEGEKCADALQKFLNEQNFNAFVTTSSQGAESTSLTDWSDLTRRQVIIMPDNDQGGETFTREVTRLVKEARSASVKVSRTFGATDSGFDVADEIKRGGDPAEIIQAISQAKPVEPEQQKAKVRVLGRSADLDVFIWADGRIVRLKPKSMDRTTLTLLTGEENFDALNKMRGDIIREAHRKGVICDEEKIGPGVWRIKDSFVVNTGTRAILFDGGNAKELEDPVYQGRIIEFRGNEWVDYDSLKTSLEGGNLQEVYSELHRHIKQYSWINPEVGEYAAGFTMLAPLQQAMSWRPFINILGPRGCGKTMFLDYILGTIYGNLFAGLGKSSAFAMAQEVGNTGRIAVFDEFEKNPKIDALLESAKLSSRGGAISRGTTGTKAISYRLNHMLWFGSIYMPAQAQTDSAISSRSVILEMKKPGPESLPPSGITEDEGRTLAGKIVGTMIKSWEVIKAEVSRMNRNAPAILAEIGAGVETRTLENYAWASAILNLSSGKVRHIPSWAKRETEDDGEKILRVIMGTLLQCPDGRRLSIGFMLGENESQNVLESYGIKKMADGRLIIHPERVQRHLLKDTPYKDLDISGPLGRMKNAKKSAIERIDGQRLKCIVIPLATWNRQDREHSERAVNTTVNNENSYTSESIESVHSVHSKNISQNTLNNLYPDVPTSTPNNSKMYESGVNTVNNPDTFAPDEGLAVHGSVHGTFTPDDDEDII